MNHIMPRYPLVEYARAWGLRRDWHEPDEQGVTAKVTGKRLDNAYGDLPEGGDEIVITLYKKVKPGAVPEIVKINLANLLADYCRLAEAAG